MNALEKIEKLEQGLAELKASLKEPKFEYPLFKRGCLTGIVVKFTGLKTGEVVVPDANCPFGDTSARWVRHTDNDWWEPVAYDKERGLFDGQLVWCWYDSLPFARELRFYDAVNKCVFNRSCGSRNAASFDRYAPFKCEWPEWAIEAYKGLKF